MEFNFQSSFQKENAQDNQVLGVWIWLRYGSDLRHDVGEHVTNRWAKKRKNDNNHNSNKYKDQCVFNKALALFFGGK